MTDEIPLFPLHTVLFPGAPLPLRIFEPRYMDMVSQCMRTGSGFGVCLIREGEEVGKAARTHELGTLAMIEDWHPASDGMLGITARGSRRFRILSERLKANQLLMAKVEYLDDESDLVIPDEHDHLLAVLDKLRQKLPPKLRQLDKEAADAVMLAWRLADLLPLKLSQKQYFLQLDDPMQRLDGIAHILENLDQ